MENENKSKELISPHKKSKDIVITQSQLKKIAVAIFVLIIIFLAFAYFNSGLTHRKAKRVFIEDWNKKNQTKLIEVKIIGMKKLKDDNYRIKISYSIFQNCLVNANGEIITKEGDYLVYLSGGLEKYIKEHGKEPGLKEEIRLITHEGDFIYTEWDTGWLLK